MKSDGCPDPNDFCLCGKAPCGYASCGNGISCAYLVFGLLGLLPLFFLLLLLLLTRGDGGGTGRGRARQGSSDDGGGGGGGGLPKVSKLPYVNVPVELEEFGYAEEVQDVLFRVSRPCAGEKLQSLRTALVPDGTVDEACV